MQCRWAQGEKKFSNARIIWKFGNRKVGTRHFQELTWDVSPFSRGEVGNCRWRRSAKVGGKWGGESGNRGKRKERRKSWHGRQKRERVAEGETSVRVRGQFSCQKKVPVTRWEKEWEKRKGRKRQIANTFSFLKITEREFSNLVTLQFPKGINILYVEFFLAPTAAIYCQKTSLLYLWEGAFRFKSLRPRPQKEEENIFVRERKETFCHRREEVEKWPCHPYFYGEGINESFAVCVYFTRSNVFETGKSHTHHSGKKRA